MQLLGLAIAPGLAIAIFIYWRDKFEREPRRLLIWAFFLGIVSIVPAVILENWWGARGAGISESLTGTAFYAFIVVGLSEEFAKYFFVRRYLYNHPEFDEPYDGITYSVMVSMGFATLENILYVLEGGMSTALMRMFTAVPAHAVFGIIMGYYMGLAKFVPERRALYHFMAVFGAMLLHGAYDFALMQQSMPEWQFGGAILSLFIGIRLSLRAIRLHQQASPFKVDAF
ncbi:MAG: PrsW family intramembrane metalloprotease [Flavobacteriales bacterium]|nr:PrsW family intramembrane metalloprotease [Flavobacteriales bacterium]